MSVGMASLVSYGTDSDSDNEAETNTKTDPDAIAHLLPLSSGKNTSLSVLNSAPEVAVKVRQILCISISLLAEISSYLLSTS